MIRIGIVGCGEVAHFGHLPAINKNPEFVVAALYDPNSDRLQFTSAKFGAPPTFNNLADFYSQGLDAVLVASPAPTHRDHVILASSKGVHVLCEKPIADDLAEALEMKEAMQRTEKIFTIGYCYRFSPVTKQIKEWVGSGVVGNIRALRLTYLWNLHGMYEEVDGIWSESHRWRSRMLEGGPMVDCGVHAIDLARYWLRSEAKSVTGHGAWVADYESPDHVWLHMNHENGAHTAVEMSFSYCHTAREPINQFSYELIGDGGLIRYMRDGYVLEARTGEQTIRVPGASEKNFEGMYAEFAHAIRTGDVSGLPTADDGITASRLAWEATNMAIANRPKNVPIVPPPRNVARHHGLVEGDAQPT